MAKSPTEAIALVESIEDSRPAAPLFTRFEVCVSYKNGDEVRGQFSDKAAAIAFPRTVR
jgi:hypothetical protein